jgi:hypothetical protein
VPPATALRRIEEMEDAELIARVSDPNDRRRHFIKLTPRTLHKFQAYVRHDDAYFRSPLSATRGLYWALSQSRRGVPGETLGAEAFPDGFNLIGAGRLCMVWCVCLSMLNSCRFCLVRQ